MTEHEKTARNERAWGSYRVFKRRGEKSTIFLPDCLGDDEVIQLCGRDTRRRRQRARLHTGAIAIDRVGPHLRASADLPGSSRGC
jgi:hypothetical protein